MYNNPFYIPDWNIRGHCLFLNHYLQVFEKYFHYYPDGFGDFQNYLLFLNPNIKPEQLINEMYFKGKFVYRTLACSFAEFDKIIRNGYLPDKYRRSDYFAKYWKFSRNWWYYYHFREKMAFTRQAHHKKKILSEKEQFEREWRKEKFERDKRKNYHRTGCKKHYKKLAHKKHRAWERNNLKKGNYEELLNNKKLDVYQNPWLWD